MNIYRVTFQYSETTYCSNVALADSREAVEAHYRKYAWANIEEGTAADLEEVERKGKPVITCEPVQPEQTEEPAAADPEPVQADAEKDGEKPIRELLIELEETKRALDRIENDPDYITARVAEIWKDKPRRDHSEEIAAIIANL